LDESEWLAMKIIKMLGWIFLSLISLVIITAVGIGFVLLALPKVSQIEGCFQTSMYHVDLCPTGAHYTKLKDIAPEVGDAVVSSEDTAFYSHKGFDWYEIEQSFKENLANKHIHRGGSTLTQQLAKNVWLSKERSYWRKLKEAYLTYELEKKYTKDFILEKYLNVVQFGPKIFGVKDAAQIYFKKSPAELHLLEGVWLAFLLPNPDVYSKSFKKGTLTPFGHKLINIILKRMVQFKKIQPETYRFAVAQVDSFPWTQLSRADFARANTNTPPEGSTPELSETPEDQQDLNQFLNENDMSEKSEDQ
jgi:monofunctional biosynthetic peptidoglycan transglycosylase